MLDSDASFFLVPEFQSSRGARRTLDAPLSDLRFGTATGADLCMALMPDHGILGVAAAADLALGCANAVPQDQASADFSAEWPMRPAEHGTEPVITRAAESDDFEDIGTEFLSFDEDAADPETAFAADGGDIRAVTPRRPMRFTFAREAVEHSRLVLPIPNIFENVFADDTLTGPGIDPRLQRGRARARARLAAHEAALPPEARNLWSDAITESAEAEAAAEAEAPILTLTETPATDGLDGNAPRRAVRQLSVTRRAPRSRPDPAAIHDPLQDHLHQIRDALYAPDPETEADAASHPAPRPQALGLHLFAACFTLAMALVMRLATALPRRLPQLRALLASHIDLLREMLATPSLRLPSRAMGIFAVVLILAQTIPPNLM